METNQPEITNRTYVGLDVSKDRLDYTVDGHRCHHVPNTEIGRKKLVAELSRLDPPARVVCEATGGYERAAVGALLMAGLEVCVVPPGRVRAFAQAEGLLAKTDKLDARLLKRFGEKVRPRLYVPMDEAAATLRELLEYRRQTSDQLVAVRNRMELAGKVLRPLLEAQARFLEEKLAEADRLIRDHIERDDNLRGKAQRLRQLNGVGPVLAATLLAYVPELGQIEDKSLSALVGVAPFARDSGNTNRKRHVRGGRAVVRHVLYMAAVATTRCNRILAEFYQRLRSAGKPASVALVAVMRKMLGVLNRLIADPHFTLAR
jgi:transposase